MKILCVGQLVADIIATPVNYTRLGTDTEVLDSIGVQGGGDAMNVAVGLARLGRKVVFCGRVGDDPFGAHLSGVLQKNGIDAGGLIVDAGVSTGSCIVLVDAGGQRIFLYCGGSNERVTPTDVSDAQIGACAHLHVGGTYLLPGLDGEGSASLFRRARERGKTTSMDVTWDVSGRWLSLIRPCLPQLTLFMPSENEAVHITGETDPVKMAAFLRAEGVGIAIIKLGARGAYVDGGDERFFVPAFDMPVVDTTGAGDSFTAGFVARYAEGRPLRDCAKYASAVAAHCIGAVGATAGVPDADTVAAFLQTRGHTEG